MNTKEYISSGILEAYLLGSLSPEESREVEDNSEKYPEVKKELRAIEDAMFHYASKFSRNPSLTLKKKVMNAVDKAEKSEKKETSAKGKTVSGPKRETAPYLVAASITIALGCAILAGMFWQKWQHAEEKIVTLQQENTRISGNINTVKFSMEEKLKTDSAQLAQVREELHMVMDSSISKVHLKGMADMTAASTGVVLWNKSSQEVFLNLKNIPEPPDSMQYQLWALHKGKPVDAGMIEMSDPEPYHKMKQVGKAESFAITLEPKGGSAKPNLDAVCMMGKL
ncbi:MAG: anti-sigma factor domain-containing protein [Cytophagaceae bacterium]